MSYTDQAFIRAYRTDTDSEPAIASAPSAGATTRVSTHPTTHSEESQRHGPHAHFGGEKRPASKMPLSKLIGDSDRRVDAAVEPMAPAQSSTSTTEVAGTTVASFKLPTVAAELACQCGDAYRRMMAYVTRSGGVIGLLGVGEGVGCTTTTLATALAFAHNTRPVAIVDAAPEGPSLAKSLGLLHVRSIARTLASGGTAADALIHSVEDNISLGVAFDEVVGEERRVSSALRSLPATHSSVLVDLGCDLESIATQPERGADTLRLDSVILIRRWGQGEADVNFARRVLSASGQTVVGVVDCFAA